MGTPHTLSSSVSKGPLVATRDDVVLRMSMILVMLTEFPRNVFPSRMLWRTFNLTDAVALAKMEMGVMYYVHAQETVDIDCNAFSEI